MFLSEINIYPIKSLGGIRLKSSTVEARGLRYDRCWMLIDGSRNFLTQREYPVMATINVEIADQSLRVSYENESLLIPFKPETNETASVKIWSGRCRAKIYEDQVNDWFQDILQTDCKLVLMPPETLRRVNYFYAVHRDDAVSFADGYPFLLTGESSLSDLNARLENPVPMNRFRPNLVVSGAQVFAEDGWKKIRIGACEFHVVKPCGRCVITTIDQEKGIKQGIEPLKTLASYRIPKRSVKRKILFGQNLIAENVGAVINVGDEIEILEETNKKRVFLNIG